MTRTYNIIYGSKRYLNDVLISHEDFDNENLPQTFMELVSESDRFRTIGKEVEYDIDTLIIRNEDYHGITNEAHYRLGAIIEDFTNSTADIFIHNPTENLLHFINNKGENQNATINEYKEMYQMDSDSENFKSNVAALNSKIIGQSQAIKSISESLWYLTNANRKKPYVILLYGESSLGKTELIREISKTFYENKVLEKHLSMFQNQTYSDYFFGDRPNSKTLCFELLQRESNLLFLDELDKCPNHFYSAFYTLFDNNIFLDSTYQVDTTGMVIFATANYSNHEEMKEKLGLPIYYRIDKFIPFNSFNITDIERILYKEVNSKFNEYSHLIEKEEVIQASKSKIFSEGENARTIKNKVQISIEELMFSKL